MTEPKSLEFAGAAKYVASACVDMAAAALSAAVPHVDGKDPLHAERYLQVADKLSEVADRLFRLAHFAAKDSF